MPEDKKIQAKKLVLLQKEPMVAMFDQLESILNVLTAKEKIETHVSAQFPPFPEFPTVDLEPTNKLLAQILAELQKPKKEEEVTVDLEII